MKQFLGSIFVLLSFTSIQAQDTLFVNEYGRVIHFKKYAKYYRIIDSENKEIRDYHLENDALGLKVSYKEDPSDRHGKATWFDQDGNLIEECTYKNGRRMGKGFRYYANGDKKREVEYTKDKTRYIQFWDEDGTTALQNGTGIVAREEDYGFTISGYKDYYIRYSGTIREEEKDTVYTIVDQNAEFPGDQKAYAKYLIKNLTYPEAAKENGVDGKVYVQFIVEKNGQITEVVTVKGIGYGCDLEAERVIKNSPYWNPALISGNPVQQKMIIPIVYKLE